MAMIIVVISALSQTIHVDAAGESTVPTDQIAKDHTVSAGKDGQLRFHVLEIAPGKGEICLVCDHPIDEDQTCVLIQFRGRTVTVNKVNLEAWRADPNRYFNKLPSRASGALFDEGAVMPDQMGGTPSWVFLIVGLYILAGLMMGGACSYVAVSRGHPPMPWFLLGLFINGIAMVMLLSKGQGHAAAPAGVPSGFKKVPATHTPTPCPGCGATNHPAATSCSGCGAGLNPAFTSEAANSKG